MFASNLVPDFFERFGSHRSGIRDLSDLKSFPCLWKCWQARCCFRWLGVSQFGLYSGLGLNSRLGLYSGLGLNSSSWFFFLKRDQLKVRAFAGHPSIFFWVGQCWRHYRRPVGRDGSCIGFGFWINGVLRRSWRRCFRHFLSNGNSELLFFYTTVVFSSQCFLWHQCQLLGEDLIKIDR